MHAYISTYIRTYIHPSIHTYIPGMYAHALRTDPTPLYLRQTGPVTVFAYQLVRQKQTTSNDVDYCWMCGSSAAPCLQCNNDETFILNVKIICHKNVTLYCYLQSSNVITIIIEVILVYSLGMLYQE